MTSKLYIKCADISDNLSLLETEQIPRVLAALVFLHNRWPSCFDTSMQQ